jgi:DNA invertase Pin-like site-specific DNA recombinase
MSIKTRKINKEKRTVDWFSITLSFEEIEEIYRAIKPYLKKTGRKPRSMPKKFPALLEKGLTYAELARAFNCSKSAVSRWKKELENEKV